MNISTNIFLNSELSNTTHQTLNYSPHDTACKSCCTRHLSLCNVLTPPELKLFSEILTDYKRKAKEIICTEDDEADFIYNIRKGTVRLYKMLPDGRRQVTGFLMAGDFFDISSNKKYNLTAEAITDVEICRFPRAKFIEFIKNFPHLSHKVFEMAQTELNNMNDQMLLLGQKSATEKLCTFILLMREKYSRTNGYRTNELHLFMSRLDIADYLGLTVETISRQFTKLHKLGLIELDGTHNLLLKKPDTILTIAQGNEPAN